LSAVVEQVRKYEPLVSLAVCRLDTTKAAVAAPTPTVTTSGRAMFTGSPSFPGVAVGLPEVTVGTRGSET